MKKLLLPLLALAALALPAKAAIDLNAIKPDGFAHGVVFTVDEYANNEDRATLTNFPVLVRLSESGISGFDYDDVLVSGGGDIRFADANGNALPFEIDTWANNATSLVWVTLPVMTNGTEFAMFYGAAHSDANAFVATRHPWADYTGVWHLGDSGTGSGKTVSDSTTNQLTGTTASNSSKLMSDGAVGGARKICASTNSKNQEQISVSLSDSAKKAAVDALVPQFSVSLWYRIKESTETSIQWDYLIGRKPSEKSNASGGWAIQMSDPSTGGGTKNGIRVWSNETTDGAPPASAIPVIGQATWTTVAWFKLDVVYDNSNYSLYLNGALVKSGALKGNAANGSSTTLGIGGAAPTADVIRPFTGDMDEVRLRRGTVSGDWVAADYATQTSASFLSAGTVEKVGASTRPTAEFEVLDTGAAFLQFSGRVTSLGEGATACTLHYKYWKDSESEPVGWTSFATGVGAGAPVSHFVVGLDPLTDYHVAFKASNNLATPEDSDVVPGFFTTSGVGDAGESGGVSERQLDEFVHTFTVTERGVSEFEFTPPTGVTKVEALVVAGGGAGGYNHGGGGGGGGLVHDDALAVVPGQTYTVHVGTGGVASASASLYGGNGGNSSIALNGAALVSATGGGAGGNGGSNTAGKVGGSGGGSSADVAGGAGMTGQGFAGAKGNGNQAGGGGGAKAAGSEPVVGGTKAVSSGGGGSGLSFEISGATVFYAGGGAGGGVKSLSNKTYGTPGTGGLGGGGDGGQETDVPDTASAGNGTDGLGGGGGGGSAVAGYEKGGDGGNGVVIIRYGAGGDGDGIVHPTISLTGLSYDDDSGYATVTYRVGWAGDGYDRADVSAIWGFHADDLDNTNAVSTAPTIGQGTGSFELPRVSKTVHVRLLATNSGNYTGVSPELKTLVLFNPAAPGGTVSSATPSYTSATFAAAVTNLGAGATSVSGAFQICTDKFFDEGTYETFEADEPISATGTLTGSATGLSPDTVYWVRALLANDVPADYDTAPVSFRTLVMGAPVGTAGAPAASDTTIAADVTISAFGTGATSATMRLEASNANDFATVVASADADATAGVAQTLIVSGLLPETTYYLRAVLVNDGGVQTVLDLGSATTTPAASPTVTLTIPSPLPANVVLVSVTTNDAVAVEGVEGVYTVLSNDTVTVTFAPQPGYRLVGDATVSVVMDANKALATADMPTAELIAAPTAILTIPELPANVSLVSVTTNGVAVSGVGGAYTILSNDTATVTFAATEGYRLVGNATVDVVMDANKTLSGIPTAELITVTLTIPEPPAGVTLVSVTTNGVAVTGNAGVYTVQTNATVVATFAAAQGYVLAGDESVSVEMDASKTLSGIPTAVSVAAPEVSQNKTKVYARQTVTLTASATDAASYRWLKNGNPIEGGTDGTLTVNWRSPKTAPTTDTYQAVAVYAVNGSTVESGASTTMTIENLPMGTVISVLAWSPEPPPPHDYSADYLTFRVLTPGTISWKAFGDLTKSIEYSINNGEWTSITSTSDGATISAEKGDLVRFKGNNKVYATSNSKYSGFEGGTATYDIEGNIMSLLYGDSFVGRTDLPNSEYIFCSLFKKAPVVSAENLVLPATTLKNYCYRALFSNCTSLTKAPELPATTLATGCYMYMFSNCTTLTNAPALPATSLANECYAYMFSNCTMLTKAPELPATTLANGCYMYMFSNCTTLTKAPELPATTLAKGCYQNMFEKCAITEAPVLNASTLVTDCYRSMFSGCSHLDKITCLAASGFGSSNCLTDWVKNVAGVGTFAKASNVTFWTTGASGIPKGWTVGADVLLLPPEVSFDGETIEMVCYTENAEIHYRLGQTGDFALYTAPISISADTVVQAYSTCQNLTSETVTQTCVYVQFSPFQRSNRDLPTWRYDDRTITTPYSVNGSDGHSPGYSTGTFSFETSVTLSTNQPTYLWFQHADQSADIYVDGVKVGTHWGGYNAFFFDISEYVHSGQNKIRVALCNTTRNALAPCAGDFNFNATLGNVKLFTSPVLPAMEYGYDGFHITSTVSASSATTNATIYVETKVPAGADLKCIVSDGSYAWTNTLASTGIEQTFTNTISNAHLWHGTIDPHLYTVTLEIYKDGDLYHKYERPYGFRYYQYVTNNTTVVPGQSYTGFLLNGRPYLLRGVCMHDDVEGKANALDDSDYDQEFAIIRELGCNFIRLAHYPHPKEVYDRCDRLGIIVQTEVPCVNKLQSSMPADYYTHLATQYTEMVQQHYNHPCIVFWGLSNETTTDDTTFAKTKVEEYFDLIKSIDSERLVGYVVSHNVKDPSGYYNNPKVDWFGCNIYVGWYVDKDKNDPSGQLNTRIANTITKSGVNKPLAFSEYGCGGTQKCHSENFKSTTTKGTNQPRHDIEYLMWVHEGHIAAIRNYPQLLFTSQWQLFDIAVYNRQEGYIECLDGETTTTNDDLKFLNNKGLVERDHRTKKDVFYLYKAEWNPTPFVHICGKDYTKTTDRKLKCYTNDGDTLSLYVGDSETPRETVHVVDHIAVFSEMDFPSGVEIRVKGTDASDTVTF